MSSIFVSIFINLQNRIYLLNARPPNINNII